MTKLDCSVHRRCSLFCLVIGMSTWTSTAPAQQPVSEVADDENILAPFVGETTFLILKVDPARLGLPKDEVWSTLPPEAKTALAQASKTLAASIQQLQTLADGHPIYATVGIPESKTTGAAFCFRRKTSAQNTQVIKAFAKDRLRAHANVQGDYLVVVPQGGKQTIASPASDSTHAAIRAAFKEVAAHPMQAVVVPPDHVWRTLRELAPQLPPQFGGGPSRVLTDGVQWVGIGLDPARLRLEVVIQSASERAAAEFAAHLPTMLRTVSETIHQEFAAEFGGELVGWLKPQVDGSKVRIQFDGLEETGGKLALVSRITRLMEGKARRQKTQQNFRQILIAMHNYHENYATLPPADKHRDKDGKHHLSWRVHLLPYLEQQALYDEFHLDEPWDSPHNKKLIEKMPDVFVQRSLDPSQPASKPGHTAFLAPVGEGTIFGGKNATKLQQITDGTSTTAALLVVSPKHAVPWTAPVDYSLDAQDPLAGVLIGPEGTWICGFADGSVSHLRGDMSAKTALHLFQMDDGNPIDFKQIR